MDSDSPTAHHDADLGTTTTDQRYTAAAGKDRFDHCRGKGIIYQTHDARPATPVKHGKKGAPGGLSAAQAPYATLAELDNTGSKAQQLPSVPSLDRKTSSESASLQAGAAAFDPAVYAANRAANVKLKEESARRNFVGNGNILSHPVSGAQGNLHP